MCWDFDSKQEWLDCPWFGEARQRRQDMLGFLEWLLDQGGVIMDHPGPQGA